MSRDHEYSNLARGGDKRVPAHDLLAAAALGMPAIRVRTGRFKASPNPPSVDLRADIADVAALEAQLDRWTQAAVFGV